MVLVFFIVSPSFFYVYSHCFVVDYFWIFLQHLVFTIFLLHVVLFLILLSIGSSILRIGRPLDLMDALSVGCSYGKNLIYLYENYENDLIEYHSVLVDSICQKLRTVQILCRSILSGYPVSDIFYQCFCSVSRLISPENVMTHLFQITKKQWFGHNTPVITVLYYFYSVVG